MIWHFLCLHLNIQSTVSQVPTVFILFIVVSVFRVAHRATAFHPDKAVESFYSSKALAGWKASRRLGKQIRGLSRFLFNPMPSCHKTSKADAQDSPSCTSAFEYSRCFYSTDIYSLAFLLSVGSLRHNTCHTAFHIHGHFDCRSI